MELPDHLRKIFVEYGKKGADRIKQKYTKEEISEMRRRAAAKRWGTKKIKKI